jgi:hypothetical protein
MAKTKITIAELAKLIMAELGRHPECAHVTSVGFTRPLQRAPQHASWAPAFSCDGPQLAPAIAFEITQRFQNQYDLV